MIIRCQSGCLLNSGHVVEWDTQTEAEDNEERHTVTAKTILDTTVEIFEGTLEECETRLAEIDESINEDGRMLASFMRGLCETR